MHCRRLGRFAADQLRPPRTVPALKAIAPNAAFRIVIPFANGLHERENVETLLLSQIHFQPARGLSLIQVPARMKVFIVRFIRSYSIGVRTGMNGLTRRQIACRDHDMLAELRHGPRMLPCVTNLLQAAHNVWREPSFAVRGSIQNQVAVSAIQRFEPVVNDSLHWLQRSIDVSLLPEPLIREGHT